MKYLLNALLCLAALSAPAFAAGEFQLLDKSLSGQTLYVLLFSGAGEADAGEAWQTGTSTWEPLTDTWADFDTALTEVGTTGNFLGTMPAIGDKNVRWVIYQDANDDATPDSAADIPLAEGSGYWATSRFGTNTEAWDGTTLAAQDVPGVPNVYVQSMGDNTITGATITDGSIDRANLGVDTGLKSIRSSTAQAGGATSITLDGSASATNDIYKHSIAYVTSGTGVGQYRMITAYDGTTKVATVSPAWATNPDLTSGFAIMPRGLSDIAMWAGSAVATPTVAGVPEIDITHILGQAATTSSDPLPVDVIKWAGSATSANNIALLTQLGSANFAANWFTAAGVAADAAAEIANAASSGGFDADERAQILAALSIGEDIGVPSALTWTIARIDGQMRARSPVVKDTGETIDVAADFRGVLAPGDAIKAEADGGIVDIELIDDSGSETITSTAFDTTSEAELWMNSAVRFEIAGGTAGDEDRIRVKVLTVNGHTLSAPCRVIVTGGE